MIRKFAKCFGIVFVSTIVIVLPIAVAVALSLSLAVRIYHWGLE